MRMYDLIMKKRNGEELSHDEITNMISEYVEGVIPDYQMSALLMAVYFQGMSETEIFALTKAVAYSGEIVDLSEIEGVKVDKHSTGGVGDKTTLIIAPIVAACGVKVAKMSGRGLGHTGGTVDKLESIPGFQTTLTRQRFLEVVNQTGLSIIGQSGNLAPADKKLYALRDVTATVDSIPLIAASIMSKKLASGNDCILLDVKMGSGAFMKSLDEAIALAKVMVSIGEEAGKKTLALITDMDTPLGYYIGNSLEVIEAANTLKGNGPKDLTEVCLNLAGNMLFLAGKGDLDTCVTMAKHAIMNGNALERMIAMVEAQGGNSQVIKDTANFEKASYSCQVVAKCSGYITSVDTEKCGIASAVLGAGRETKESKIDFTAGIILHYKVGDWVEKGKSIATLYASNKALFARAQQVYEEGIIIGDTKPKEKPLILARITANKVEKYI
ncbi:MAG: pyrimidine-nucleoside phosphorylase [Lachnospiraceae bacterium]